MGEGQDARDPEAVARLARAVDAVLAPYFRAEVRGLERLPDGPALYVGNHNGGLLTPDSFLFAAAAHRERGLEAVPYVLAGDAVVANAAARRLLEPLGAVRARSETAARLLGEGRKVLVYPGGDLDAMRPFRDRDRVVFGGRTGYVRLALRAGAPIVPVVAAGAHSGLVIVDDGRWLAKALRADRWLRVSTWPIAVCAPWGLVIGPALVYLPPPTRILVEALPPIRFERTGEAAANDEGYVRSCAARVEAELQGALSRLARERRSRRPFRAPGPRASRPRAR